MAINDLIIVGGGPVGLSAGIYAALNGLSVTILDSKQGVIDKACGEGLMPGGVHILQQLGVDIPVKRVFRGIRYIDNQRMAQGHFHDGPGWGIRRTVLHQALQQRARALGVNILQHKVKHITQAANAVSVDQFQCRYLLGADGLKSTVRRAMKVNVKVGAPNRYGVRQHFAVPPWSDYVEVHWSPHAEAYVTPVDENTVGVALLFGEKFRQQMSQHGNASELEAGNFHKRALNHFPFLRERCLEPASRTQGAGPFKTLVSQHVVGRVLLIGDAAGYLDPMTGEGIRLGFVTAQAAVNTIMAEQPATYEKQWRRITRRYIWATTALLLLRQSERLRQLIIPTLQTSPWLFDKMLAQLESGGNISPSRLAPTLQAMANKN